MPQHPRCDVSHWGFTGVPVLREQLYVWTAPGPYISRVYAYLASAAFATSAEPWNATSAGPPCLLNSTIPNQAGSVNSPAGSWPGPDESLGASRLTMRQCPMASRASACAWRSRQPPYQQRAATKRSQASGCPALLHRRAPPRRSALESLPHARPGELPQKPRSGSEGSEGRYVLLKTGMRNIRHSGLLRAAQSAGPGSRRRRNAERVTVSPPDATIGYLPQEPERRPDQTVRQFLARRTGVGRGGQRRDAGPPRTR